MSILNISLAIFLTEMFNKNYPPPPKKKNGKRISHMLSSKGPSIV